MERIRSWAITVQHKAVHTVQLHSAKQQPHESVKAFAARVRGIASNCGLKKKCSCTPATDVSYLEETVHDVVLTGLRDQDLQEKCTAQALLGNISDIQTLVSFCTAEENGSLGTHAPKSSYRKERTKQQKTSKTAVDNWGLLFSDAHQVRRPAEKAGEKLGRDVARIAQIKWRPISDPGGGWLMERGSEGGHIDNRVEGEKGGNGEGEQRGEENESGISQPKPTPIEREQQIIEDIQSQEGVDKFVEKYDKLKTGRSHNEHLDQPLVLEGSEEKAEGILKNADLMPVD